MVTTTDNLLAAIEERTANPNRMNANQLHAAVQDDVPWLIAELRAAREVIEWYADDGNYDASNAPCMVQRITFTGPDDVSVGRAIERTIYDRGQRAGAYLNRGEE